MHNRMLNCLPTGKLIMWNWTDAIRCHLTWTLVTRISVGNWTIPDDRWFIPAVGQFIRFMPELAWVDVLCEAISFIALIRHNPFQPNFSSIIHHCNLWRNYDDIQDSWSSLETIIDYYGNNQEAIVPNAGPGHWNDPDMVSNIESILVHRSS